jgi:hypothetical protein
VANSPARRTCAGDRRSRIGCEIPRRSASGVLRSPPSLLTGELQGRLVVFGRSGVADRHTGKNPHTPKAGGHA